MALAVEGVATINLETWKKALAAHPELSPHYTQAKGKFLVYATGRLAHHPDPKFLCWLLERRHSDLFHKPDGDTINLSATANANAGLPPDVVELARQIAAGEAAAAKTVPVKVKKDA